MARRSNSRSTPQLSNARFSPAPQPSPSTKEKWLGSPAQQVQIPLHTPEGMEALQDLLTFSRQGLRDPYAGFEPIRQDTLRTFQEDILPTIAERFAKLGSGGALSSSGYVGAQHLAGERLAKQLAAMQSEYGLRNRQGLLDMLQLGLTPQYEYGTIPSQPGNLENWVFPAAKTASNFLNFIPGIGPLLSALTQGGVGLAENYVSSRRGGDMSADPFSSFGALRTPQGMKQTTTALRDFLKDRRLRSQTSASSSPFVGAISGLPASTAGSPMSNLQLILGGL